MSTAALPHNFTHVVERREPYDVCRVFLACLQLANDGDVELLHDASEASASDAPLELRLLRDSHGRPVAAT